MHEHLERLRVDLQGMARVKLEYLNYSEIPKSSLEKLMSKEKVLHCPLNEKRSSSREFVAPSKLQHTLVPFMRGGDTYGVGMANPVGKEKARSMAQGPIPQESSCFRSEEVL